MDSNKQEEHGILNTYLSKIGLQKTDIDPCVYTSGVDSEDRVIVVIYVDDLLIATSSLEKLKYIKDKLMKKFKIRDLGPVFNILGRNVTREGAVVLN